MTLELIHSERSSCGALVVELTRVVLSGGHTTLKLFFAVGFKNFNIIHPPLEVKIDTKARPHGLKVYCDAVMIHATE